MTSMPPKKGRSCCGTITLPSACNRKVQESACVMHIVNDLGDGLFYSWTVVLDICMDTWTISNLLSIF
jgi:hypothetical protein